MSRQLCAGEIYIRANGQYVLILAIDKEKDIVQFEVLSPPQLDAKGALGIVGGKGNWQMPGDRKTVTTKTFIRALIAAGNPTLKKQREQRKQEKS
jgi:hypothetical protein